MMMERTVIPTWFSQYGCTNSSDCYISAVCWSTVKTTKNCPNTYGLHSMRMFAGGGREGEREVRREREGGREKSSTQTGESVLTASRFMMVWPVSPNSGFLKRTLNSGQG